MITVRALFLYLTVVVMQSIYHVITKCVEEMKSIVSTTTVIFAKVHPTYYCPIKLLLDQKMLLISYWLYKKCTKLLIYPSTIKIYQKIYADQWFFRLFSKGLFNKMSSGKISEHYLRYLVFTNIYIRLWE